MTISQSLLLSVTNKTHFARYTKYFHFPSLKIKTSKKKGRKISFQIFKTKSLNHNTNATGRNITVTQNLYSVHKTITLQEILLIAMKRKGRQNKNTETCFVQFDLSYWGSVGFFKVVWAKRYRITFKLRNSKNSSLLRLKNTKVTIISRQGTKVVKDGED